MTADLLFQIHLLSDRFGQWKHVQQRENRKHVFVKRGNHVTKHGVKASGIDAFDRLALYVGEYHQ